MITPPAALEAILFASGEPLAKDDIRSLLGISAAELDTATMALAKDLSGRGIALIETAQELELRTSADAAAIVKRFRESELAKDLGKAGLETLAVIAYQNGSTRGEIDWIRGVNSSTSVRTLLLRGLIEGREDASDRRRIRYSITTDALAHLGVTRAEDLPRFGELSKAAKEVVLEQATAVES